MKTFILIVLIDFKCYSKCINSTCVVILINFRVFNILGHFYIENNIISSVSSRPISDNPVFRITRFRIIGVLLYYYSFGYNVSDTREKLRQFDFSVLPQGQCLWWVDTLASQPPSSSRWDLHSWQGFGTNCTFSIRI